MNAKEIKKVAELIYLAGYSNPSRKEVKVFAPDAAWLEVHDIMVAVERLEKEMMAA